MARGGGMPGLGNMPGGGGKKARGRVAPPVRGKKGKSGNPALRAKQEREALERALGGGVGAGAGAGVAAAPGAAFGLGAKQEAPVDASQLELPPGLSKYLGRG